MFAKSHQNNPVCLFEVFSRDVFFNRLTLKVNFCSRLKLWKDKKKFLPNSTNEKKFENEQALEKNIEEDEKVSEELKERKLKRKSLAEKNTALKEAAKKYRKSRPEVSENELWERLDTLNKMFKVMKDLKKQNKSKKNLVV